MPTYRVAPRLQSMGGAGAFDAINRARELEQQGRRIIHLEVGEPDFDTPAHIHAAVTEALTRHQTHYAPSQGLSELRTAVARHVSRTRGVQVGPERVVIGPGCKQLIFAVLSALVGPGDEVLYQAPSYPAYEAISTYLGATAIGVPLREDRQFRMDVDEMRSLVSPRTRLLILNSPQNPSGGTLSEADCRCISEICQEKDILVLSDEIYSRILYEGTYASVYSQPGMMERTVLIDGFSKSYAMTGWRLGYAVLPAPVCSAVVRLLINSVSCVTTFVQWAGVAALDGPQDEVDRMVAVFQERREVLVDGLNSLPGIHCQKARGAFYAFPNVRELGHSSAFLANYLLEEAGVACLSGTAFGPLGEGYLRLSFANSVDNLHYALASMREALSRLTAGV